MACEFMSLDETRGELQITCVCVRVWGYFGRDVIGFV